MPRITETDIAELYYKENEEERMIKGIEWTHRQVYDVFQFLSAVSEVIEIKPDDVQFDSIGTGDEANESLDQWFQADADAIKAVSGKKGEDSWYNRMASVCNSVVLNLLHLHYRFNDEKGRRTYLSKQAFRNVLMYIPTQPLKSGKRDPFPISSGTLAEWIAHFEDIDLIRELSPPPHPYIKELNEIESDVFAPMPEGSIAAAVEDGEDHNREVVKNLMSEFVQKGGDLMWYSDQDFTNILSFPPAPMHSKHLSEWTAAMENSNAIGAFRLCVSRFDNELLRVCLLQEQLTRETNFLRKCRDETLDMAKKYMEAREIIKERAGSWMSLREETSKLDEMIVEFERNPVLKSYMERELAAGQTKAG
jgi:hypothetical protein